MKIKLEFTLNVPDEEDAQNVMKHFDYQYRPIEMLSSVVGWHDLNDHMFLESFKVYEFDAS